MMLEKYKRYYPLAGALALLILGWLTFYTVRETEFVLITQFGRPLYTVTDAGLHAKWFFQSTNYFDRRLRVYNPRPSEFLTHDKKNLVIESYVAWRIQDPKRFVETVRPEDIGKLDQVLQALVLEPRGGLFGACQKSGDFIQELADPMVDQAAAFLGELLPVTDVAEFPDSDKVMIRSTRLIVRRSPRLEYFDGEL